MDKDLAILIISLLILLLLFLIKRLTIKKLATYHSDISGSVEIWQKYNLEKMLTINGFPQGISINDPSIKKSYWYFVAEATVKFCQNQLDPQILILGLGSGTISSLISRFNPKIRQTVIEIDPIIVQLCQKFFDLNKIAHLKLIIADGYKFLSQKNNLKDKFDVIILDIAQGEKQIIPNQSSNINFIKNLNHRVKDKGLIIFNRDAHTENLQLENQHFVKSISTLFKQIDNYSIKDPRGYQNSIIIAKT